MFNIRVGVCSLLTYLFEPYSSLTWSLFAGTDRVYELGFGYGATWGSIVLIFASVVLLICDRESEEIFYKERQIEEEEEGEEEA